MRVVGWLYGLVSWKEKLAYTDPKTSLATVLNTALLHILTTATLASGGHGVLPSTVYPQLPTHVQVSSISAPAPEPQPLPQLDYLPYHFDPPGTDANPYPVGQCTWLAASMKGDVPVWGDADMWPAGARAAGIPVSDIPIIGSLGISRVGNHVVVVKMVDRQAGTVTVEEGNYDYNGSIREYTYPISKFVYIWLQ